MATTYDFIMQSTERRCLGAWRGEILAEATGAVLEIGAGTGINLPYFPEQLTSLQLCEPDPHMRRKLSRTVSSSKREDIAICPWTAEQIDLPDNSIDTIVSTLVLCSVNSLQSSLKEIYRLLKPGGTFIFMEHILAADPKTKLWQQRIEPFWGLCAGECHLTRDTATEITATGFHIEQLTEAAMIGAPTFVKRTVRGRARKTLY
ncbi:MAG: methyltransferase domain-containing protein [Desulfuromonas sp.]|nr:methyltransferase domain-containing protein [Desulfuromonas sp.]